MSGMLQINEIFHSIQGESTHAGEPCVFVRLTGCNLRCVWCDTAYAFHEGKKMSVAEVLTEVEQYGCPLVEITGGEPLLQSEVVPLMEQLLKKGHRVLIETSGSAPVGSWQQVSLVYTAMAADAGKKIGIKMQGAQFVSFEDVTLTQNATVPVVPASYGAAVHVSAQADHAILFIEVR